MIAKALNLYFFKLSNPKITLTDFALQYSQEELFQEISSKVQDESTVEVLGEVEMTKLFKCIEDRKFTIKPLIRFKKREFINNLRYTKDFLIQDKADKIELERILLKYNA